MWDCLHVVIYLVAITNVSCVLAEGEGGCMPNPFSET